MSCLQVDISRRRRGGMPSNARMGNGERGHDEAMQSLIRAAKTSAAARLPGSRDAVEAVRRIRVMRTQTTFLMVVIACCGCGGAATSASDAPGRIAVSSAGVRVVIPATWRTVEPAPDRPVTDPRTLLVVGTDGVRAKRSQCQIAAYRVPARGAVVVVVGWAHGEWPGPEGHGPLAHLTRVKKPSFECFTGRGTVAQVRLRQTAYQVNVMVGDSASRHRIAEALAVARSFNLSR